MRKGNINFSRERLLSTNDTHQQVLLRRTPLALAVLVTTRCLWILHLSNSSDDITVDRCYT